MDTSGSVRFGLTYGGGSQPYQAGEHPKNAKMVPEVLPHSHPPFVQVESPTFGTFTVHFCWFNLTHVEGEASSWLVP